MSSALRHLHFHGMRKHCVHGHGTPHGTLDTGAALELDVPPPGSVCSWSVTLVGSSVATEPRAGRFLTLCLTAPLELDAPPPGSVCSWPGTLGITALLELDDDSAGVTSALGRFLALASHLHWAMSLGLGLFWGCGGFFW